MTPALGCLTTHVLDLTRGAPAEGLTVALWQLAPGDARRVLRVSRTDRDGRTAEPLAAGTELTAGVYELIFEVGAYFRGRGWPAPDPAFLEAVPVRVGIADAADRYHVPLLVTPWSYTTYRGR